jgi:hypothetical protein
MLVVGPALAGEQNDTGGVSAQGTATIARPAEFLRMQIELSAKDKDAKEAVAALKKLKEAAVTKVGELGAVKESVKFGEPSLGGAGGNSEAEMRRIMIQRMRGETEPAKAGQPIVVIIRLTADWPLKGEGEDLMLAAYELQEKIRAADLAGTKAGGAKKEEEEDQEEGEEMMQRPPQKPGEPMFSYVIKLKPEERAKAEAEAFAKATAVAARLAKAAGRKIEDVKDLGGDYSNVNRYRQYQYMDMGIDPSEMMGDEESEAIGMQPTKIEHKVMIRATYGTIRG